MKQIIYVLFSVVLCFYLTISHAQNAQSWFPPNAGFHWYYATTPLDSMNQPQSDLAAYSIDSLVQTNLPYNGRTASLVLTRYGTAENAIYDSGFVAFDNMDAWLYLNPMKKLMTTSWLDSLGIVLPLENRAGWYKIYDFDYPVISPGYSIFSWDTTLTLDSLEIPLRFETKGRRLNDQTVEVEIGSFTCKRFVLTSSIGYVSPLAALPIFSLTDTVWIAPERWIVRRLTPSQNLDLNEIAQLLEMDTTLPVFTIYGREVEAVDTVRWSFPPEMPRDPLPANGDSLVSIHTGFQWACADPDGDELTYDLYAGNIIWPDSLLASGLTQSSFQPTAPLGENKRYYWRVVAYDNDGYQMPGPVWSFKTESQTRIDETAIGMKETPLIRLFPNPGSHLISIEVIAQKNAQGYLRIFDLNGRQVANLLHGCFAAGSQKFFWKGLSDSGQAVASGIYLLIGQIDNVPIARKILWVH